MKTLTIITSPKSSPKERTFGYMVFGLLGAKNAPLSKGEGLGVRLCLLTLVGVITNKKNLFLLALLFLFAGNIYAQEADKAFQQGNDLYKKKDYAGAVKAYESVINKGSSSGALYFNLGNAYFRLNEIPKAVLYFEKARILDPNDEDIQYNLRLANLKIVDKVEPKGEISFYEFMKNIIDFRPSSGWGAWAVVSIWLALLMFALFLFSQRFILKKTGFYGGIAFLVLFFAFLALGWQRHGLETEPYAIITASESNVKTSPEDSSGNAFVLHGGTKVKIQENVGEWNYIRLTDGKAGWAKIGDMARI